jgi:hypothetical protein
MEEALAKFDLEARHIVDTFLAKFERWELPIIYHYTNDVGLRGILETGRLWLTDVFSLNDPSELRHGVALALSVLDAKAACGPLESKIFARRLRSFIQERGAEASGHYFLCSLSSFGDDLGQWRAYGDDGRGYALGFDVTALESGFAKHSAPLVKAFPITYNDAELIEILRKIIEAMFSFISLPRRKNLDTSTVNEYMAKLTTLLVVHALHAALHFKHEAYRNEQEYRFLEVHSVDQPPEVKLRIRP